MFTDFLSKIEMHPPEMDCPNCKLAMIWKGLFEQFECESCQDHHNLPAREGDFYGS